MQTFESFIASLNHHINGLEFLPTILFSGLLMVTFGWSALNRRLKLALSFAGGVVLLGVFFERIIDKYLFPDLHSYVPLVLGGITAGLLELGAVLVSNRIMIIGIFFCGAILPLFCLHLGIFELTDGSLAIPLIMIAVIGIFIGMAMLKITKTKLFQLIASAIGGALGIVCLTGLPYELAHWAIFNIDGIKALTHNVQKDPITAVICLSISGMVVQSLIHLLLWRTQRQKTESSKYAVTEQNRVRVII